MKQLVIWFAAMGLMAASLQAEESGIVTHESANTYAETISKLEQNIESRGLKIIARIDHAKGAAAVGQSLSPTYVVIFGSPKVGTPVMVQDQRAGLDLPMRILVHQKDDTVFVTYRSPDALTWNWNISKDTPQIGGMKKGLAGIVAGAIE